MKKFQIRPTVLDLKLDKERVLGSEQPLSTKGSSIKLHCNVEFEEIYLIIFEFFFCELKSTVLSFLNFISQSSISCFYSYFTFLLHFDKIRSWILIKPTYLF